MSRVELALLAGLVVLAALATLNVFGTTSGGMREISQVGRGGPGQCEVMPTGPQCDEP